MNTILHQTVKDAALRTMLEHTTDMIFIKDIHLVYVAASMPFVYMTGNNSIDDIIGKNDYEIFAQQELAKRYTDDDRKLLQNKKDLIRYIEPLTDQNGSPRYSSTSKYILYQDDEPIGLLGISRDITNEIRVRQRHQQELHYLFELPVDTYAALFMDIDDWRIIRHQRHQTGENCIPQCETMDDFVQNALQCLASGADQEVVRFYQQLSKSTMLEICDKGTRTYHLEYPRCMPNGETIWVQVTINFLLDPESSHHCAMWTLRNIQKEKEDTLELVHAAKYDALTGLLNRNSTIKSIETVLAQKKQSAHALFIVDADNFKSLNDNYGHQEGDAFLRRLADIFKGCFRESDIIGRMGGDEFFILMKDIPNATVAAEKANRLLEDCSILASQYPDLELSLSLGISLYPENGTTLETLYYKADTALYQSKDDGKNRFTFA